MNCPETASQIGSMLRQMAFRNPLAWLESFAFILIEQVLSRFTANILQRRFVAHVMFCLKRKLPIRIICLKPRQRGISTISIGVMDWICKRFKVRGAIVGGIKEQAENLMRILKTYVDNDQFPWGYGCDVVDGQARYGNGSLVTMHSAEQGSPGRSATFQAAVMTEVGWWNRDGSVRDASGVLAAFMATLKQAKRPYIVLESTSSGPSGMFYRQWQEAVTPEEFRADPVKHAAKFVRIFAGVFEFPDIYEETTPQEAAEILDGVGARNHEERTREKQLQRRYNLSAGQIKAWRTLLRECDNDPVKRDLEYPVTPEDAWQAAQLCRFNQEGLRVLEDQATRAATHLHYGVIERQPGTEHYAFRRVVTDIYNSEVVVAEHPEQGRRYTVIVDTMKGRASDDKGRELDCHAVGVMREGYFAMGKWVKPKLVATIRPPNRSEPFQIAERAWELAQFYGNCMIVVEANNDPGVIPYLRLKKNVKLWQEVKPASDAAHAGETTGRFGFWMADGKDQKGVRGQIISALAKAVTELATDGEGIEIPFLWVIEEMKVFVRDPDTGRCEAMPGQHDDWVMMLCMGMATHHSGTIYVPPAQVMQAPRGPSWNEGMPPSFMTGAGV